ncbi:MAG: radical SAM protein [Patescibacteria group bacterium]
MFDKITNAVIETTASCNLNCRHCGSGCVKALKANELTADEWLGVFDQLRELGLKQLALSGGETTIKDDFPQLLDGLKEKQLGFALITNGLTMTDDLAKRLKDSGAYTIGVSIDGDATVHNYIRGNCQSWRRALNAIATANSIGLPVTAITTVNRLNYMMLHNLANTLYQVGASGWQVQLISPIDRAKGNSKLMINERIFRHVCLTLAWLRRNYDHRLDIRAADCFNYDCNILRGSDWPGCTAGKQTVGIDACGNVLPCLSLMDERFILGNIRQKTLREIWQQDSEVMRFFRDDKICQAAGICQNCQEYSWCQGGCKSMALAHFDKFGRAPFCCMHSLSN